MVAESEDRYEFETSDWELVTAAKLLLRKASLAPHLRPAELVSIAKLLHVLDRVPLVPEGLEVSVSVGSPRRAFDDGVETRHWWEVRIEGDLLTITSGGYFYRPTTGGDSFTAMTWEAVPNQVPQHNDYRDHLTLVPDLVSFRAGVDSVGFENARFSIEIDDQDNPLLDETVESAEEDGGEEQE